ncbi:MAG: guanylate kinase [Dehalococcoidia bacterium]|nr:MAG: guanylate kinase [Chloroflexota bacterium]
MSFIVVLSGPSGVGKDSIIEKIIKKNKNFFMPVTMTSRLKRNNEVEGKDYLFVSEDVFKEKIKKNELVEYSTVYKNFYGLPKSSMEAGELSGKNIILRLDVKGALNLVKQFSNAVSIFITPEDIDQLIKQLNARNQEEESEIDRRIAIANNEINAANLFDHVVMNEKSKLDETVEIILDLILYKK